MIFKKTWLREKKPIKIGEKMIAHLHTLKRDIEKGWKKKFRFFTGPCCNLIGSWLNEGQWLGRKEFRFIDSFSENLLAGDVHSSVTMDRNVQFVSAYSLEAWSRILAGSAGPTVICLLTWAMLGEYSHFPTT